MPDLFVLPEIMTQNYLIRLLAACILGAMIGFERDLHGRAAGLRTNLIVSLGAAIFMIISQNIAALSSVNSPDSIIRADPGRIAAQIISGIGFLGAGAIIKMGFSVRGLTTAACLWLSAAIGMSAGAGFYGLAMASTLLGLFALIMLNKFEKMYSKDSYRLLDITADNKIDISEIIDVIKKRKLKILYFDKEINYKEKTVEVRFTIKINNKDITDKLSHLIINDIEQVSKKIHSIKWHHQ